MDIEFKYWKLIHCTLQKDFNLIKYKDKEFYLSDRRATNGELRSDNIVNYIQNNPQKTMKDVASLLQIQLTLLILHLELNYHFLICTMLALRRVILKRRLSE